MRGESLRHFCENNDLNIILEQFDMESNYPYTPDNVSKASDLRLVFKYKCGHSKKQRVADKTGKKSLGCPLCLNRGGIGKSLLSEYPEYARMFMEEKNKIRVSEITQKNGEKYWWKCLICNYEFEAKVSDVTTGHRVCPECSNKKRSDAERILGYYLLKLDAKRIINYMLGGYKYDFFLPQYNLAIEYDGYPWHNTERSRNNDVRKDCICRENNIVLLRLRDKRLKKNEGLCADIWEYEYDTKFTYLEGLPVVLRDYVGEAALKLKIKPDIDARNIAMLTQKELGEMSLLSHMPILAEYIDPDDKRNGDPSLVVAKTNKIRFWLRDPKYKNLKWSMTAHELFAKEEPTTQWVNMCKKLIDKYPELEEQVSNIGNHIRESTTFTLTCKCGKTFTSTYAKMYWTNKRELCEDCLTEFRINNIRESKLPRRNLNGISDFSESS